MIPRRHFLYGLLFSKVDLAMLVYFRIVFGLTVFAWASKTLFSGDVVTFFVQPRFHFTYSGFDWVAPLPGEGMRLFFVLLIGCALAMVIGLFYRLASLIVAIGFTYVFLIDKVCYQNHYYLICLLSWIMVILPAGRGYSLDSYRRPDLRSDSVPAWTLALLRFQIALPYFYGGVAKIDSDWLQGQPLRAALKERVSTPLFGSLLTHDWATWFFSYGGMIFDLLVVPALMWRRTRPWAFAIALLFHLTNATLFKIGVFPWFMILATVIYFPADFLRKLCRSFFKLRQTDGESSALQAESATALPLRWSRARTMCTILLAVYCFVQLALPLRYLAYSGNVNWTEIGHRFSWHMMLRTKRHGIRYYAVELENRSVWPVDLRPYLTEYQVIRYGRDPTMIHHLAKIIAKDLSDQGYHQIRIHVLALLSLNGRKPQLLIDPWADMASEQELTWWTLLAGKRPDWIVPLSEPLRWHAWDVPLQQWEHHVDLPPFMSGGTYPF